MVYSYIYISCDAKKPKENNIFLFENEHWYHQLTSPENNWIFTPRVVPTCATIDGIPEEWRRSSYLHSIFYTFKFSHIGRWSSPFNTVSARYQHSAISHGWNFPLIVCRQQATWLNIVYGTCIMIIISILFLLFNTLLHHAYIHSCKVQVTDAFLHYKNRYLIA